MTRRRLFCAAVALASSLAASAACSGGAARRGVAATASPVVDAKARADATADAGDPRPSLDALAARGPTDAPLMREVLRVEDAAAQPVEVRVLERDTCVRLAFAAKKPVRAWLEDESRAPRGDTTGLATSGLVPPRGPACARKGEALRLVLDGGGEPVAARAVLWQSP